MFTLFASVLLGNYRVFLPLDNLVNTMTNPDSCESCNFESVKPNAQFMFRQIERCDDCGMIRRSGNISDTRIPRIEEEILSD